MRLGRNFDVHERGMDHVSELLTSLGWEVSVKRYGRDDYLEVRRPQSQNSHIIKVKALSGVAPVPFYIRSPATMKSNYFVIIRNLKSNQPEIFTATKKEVENAIHVHKENFWLETRDYEKFSRGFAKIESL